MDLNSAYISERGLNPKRPVNQDCFLVMPERGLFAVFDGVGGQRAGEVASQTAAETIEEALAGEAGSPGPDAIRRAIEYANRDIRELAGTTPDFKTMATTVALVQLDGTSATIAHVGDSRVYRLESGRLRRETIDHTDIDDDLRRGLISPEAAASQEDRHIINRALGADQDVEVEMKTIRVREGVRFLLCTDGVYRHIPDPELEQILCGFPDPQRACDEIKRLVYERGAEDNMTVVVVQAGRAPAYAEHGIPAGGRIAMKAKPARRAETGSGSQDPGGRINVRLNDQGPVRQAPPQQPRSVSHYLIYLLVLLVVAVGAFYAGVRSPEFIGKRNAQPSVDALQSARAAVDHGDYQAAQVTLAGIITREPQNGEAYYWLGRVQLARREYSNAARSFEQAIQFSPALDDAYVQAAAAWEAEGDRTKALEMLRRYAERRRQQQG